MKNVDDLAITFHLDPFEKKILFYIYKHIHTIKKIGIRKIAKDNFTSTHTIIKLAKKIGYEGYADMIYSLYYENQKLSSQKLTEKQSLYDFIAHSVTTYEAQLLHILKKYKRKKIIVFGLGYSENIARYINDKLLLNGYNSFFSTHLQLFFPNNIKTKPLLIIISESGENSRLLEIILDSKKHHIETLCFTTNKDATLAKKATFPFIIENTILSKNNKVITTFFAHLILFFDYIL